MEKLLGGEELTIQNALSIVKHVNRIPKSKCEYYRFALDSHKEVFVMYGNEDVVIAETFQGYPNEKGKYVLKPQEIGRASINIDDEKSELYIKYITVEEEYRNQNIGSEILNFIEAYCTKKDIERISLECINVYVNERGMEYSDYKRKGAKANLEQFKKESKYVVNKNLNFYLKSKYHLAVSTLEKNKRLTPLAKSNLVYKPSSIENLKQLFTESQIHKFSMEKSTKSKIDVNKKFNISQERL